VGAPTSRETGPRLFDLEGESAPPGNPDHVGKWLPDRPGLQRIRFEPLPPDNQSGYVWMETAARS
jgi:hypothetical protein